jgi:hypothetical protein
MSASNSSYQAVSFKSVFAHTSGDMHPARAIHLFVALTSSDGYKGMLSHLGPDAQVERDPFICLGNVLTSLHRRRVCSWLPSDLGCQVRVVAAFCVVIFAYEVLGLLRSFAAQIAETFFHDSLFADILRLARVKSIHEYNNFVRQRNEFVKEFYEKVNRLHLASHQADGYSNA